MGLMHPTPDEEVPPRISGAKLREIAERATRSVRTWPWQHQRYAATWTVEQMRQRADDLEAMWTEADELAGRMEADETRDRWTYREILEMRKELHA